MSDVQADIQADFQAGDGPGELLRKLRTARRHEGRRLTISELEIHANVTRKIISGLENGHRQTLRRDKLDGILGFLNECAEVPYTERGIVLRAFGYEEGNGLPTEADIQKAVQEWASWKESKFPVYLTDFAFRIHDWNDLIPLFLGMQGNAEALRTLTVIDLAFGDALKREGIDVTIVNGPEYLKTWIEDMKTELSRYEDDAWYGEFVALHCRKYPAFKLLWESVPFKKTFTWEPKLLPSLYLSINGSEPFQFRISGPELSTDHRFRIIAYHPFDVETGNRCFALLAGSDGR